MSNKVKWQISNVSKIDGKKDRYEMFIFNQTNKVKTFEKETLRVLVETDNFVFSMVNKGNKMLGYHFEFSEAAYPSYTNERTAIFILDEKKDPKMNVLFEDSIIRLLSYEEDKKETDYWLVGRWRY